MWWKLNESIREFASVRVREHETYMKAIHDENARRLRRSTGQPDLLSIQRPGSWELDAGFNPYLVRKRADTIAYAMTERLRKGEYEPRRPAGFLVPKPGGAKRLVSTFQIGDEVISNRLLRSLTRKNLPRISSRAYAYRPDLTPHDAIAYARAELHRHHRVFIAEYDFTKFFENISHEYVLGLLDRLDIFASPLERDLISQFLTTPPPYTSLSEKAEPAARRTCGIPQGTSVSLFLANLAATELDMQLERLGVGFVRYADDTIIWGDEYDNVCAAAEAMHQAAERIGAPINSAKSPGIRLLVDASTEYIEMSSTHSVDYLGHSLNLRTTRFKDATVAKIQKRIKNLIYTNLLKEPLEGTQDRGRLTDTDRDYATLIWQIRRYLYGPLSENQVRRFHRGSVPPMSFQGLMSFFPLIDDEDQLNELDRWMATQIWLAMRKRERLLAAQGYPRPAPLGVARADLIGFTKASGRTTRPVDLRIPSFRRIASVVRSGVRAHGFGIVSGGGSMYLYEEP